MRQPHEITRFTAEAKGSGGIPELGFKTEWERESYSYYHEVLRDSGVWIDVNGMSWRTPSSYRAHSAEYRLGTRSADVKRPDYYTWHYEGVTPQHDQVIWTPFDAGYGAPAIDHSILDRLENKVMVKLAAVDVNAGAELGESRETLRMLADKALTAAAAFKAIKSKDMNGLKKALGIRDRKDFAGNVGEAIGKRRLEFEYGWKPLIMSTADLVDKFHKGLKRPQVLSARSVHKDSYPVTLELANKNRVLSVSGSSDRLHICKIFASPKGEYLDALGQLGVTNPLGVMWELMPYSFVIDWFIPVGDILEAASLTHSMNCLGGYRAVWQQQSTSSTELFEHEVWGPDGTVHGSRAITTFKSKGYVRQAYGLSFPWPKLISRSALGGNQLFNAAALLRQNSRKF